MMCTDRNMIVPALFVARSVMERAAAAANRFDVVIVTDTQSVDQTQAEWMARQGILHKVIDFHYLRSIFADAGRLTAGTLVKLTLAEIYARDYDRILYLDADLTIHADVSVLFDLDLNGQAVAANPRGVIMRSAAARQEMEAHLGALGMTRPFRFFNSGVLLIDVARWNALDLTCRTLDFIAMNRALCTLPDEHGLNAVLNGRFAPLSPVWNMQPRRRPFMGLHRLVEPAIVHYSGHDKPWQRFGRDKPLFPDMEGYRAYRRFIRASPWPGWLARQWTIKDLRDAVVSALGRDRDRWRGRSSESGAGLDEDYLRRFASYIAEADFADIEQGLTVRTGSRLAPKRRGG